MPLQGPLDEYRKSDNSVDWNKIFSAYQNASFAGTKLTDLQKQDAELKQNVQAGGVLGSLVNGGKTLLKTAGDTLGYGAGVLRGGLFGVANEFGAGIDANKDGVVDDRDNLVGSLGNALTNPGHVAGFGDTPWLKMKEGDNLGMRALKGVAAFAGDVATDPLTYLTGGASALGQGERVALAGTNAAELAVANLTDDAAKAIAKKALEKETEASLLQRVVGVVGNAPEAELRIAGQSKDKIASSLVDALSPEDLTKIASEHIGTGAQAAYRAGKSIGLKQNLVDTLGQDLGEAMFKKMDDAVVNRLQFHVPFTDIRKTIIQNSGGGEILGKIPGFASAVGMEAKASNFVRSKLPAIGKLGTLVRDAQSQAVHGITDEALQAERLLSVAQEAYKQSAKNTGSVVKAAREWVGAVQSAKKTFKGESSEFDDIYKKFYMLDDEAIAAIPAMVDDSIENAALNAVKAQRNMEGMYVDFKNQFERAGGSSAVAQEFQDSLDNEFTKFGVIEGPRRVLTEDGRKWLEEILPKGGKIVGGSAGGGKRSAFEVVSDAGEHVRWLNPEEINKVEGRLIFEEDPYKIGQVVAERMRRAVSSASISRVFQDAGLAFQLPDAEISRVSTIVEAARNAAGKLESKAETLSNKASDIVDRAGTLTDSAAARLADNPTEERLAQIRAEREAAFTRTVDARSAREEYKGLQQRERELSSMQRDAERQARRDARERAAAATAEVAKEDEALRAARGLHRDTKASYVKKIDYLKQSKTSTIAEIEKEIRDDFAFRTANGEAILKKDIEAAVKQAKSKASEALDKEIEEVARVRDLALSEHNAAVAKASEKKSLAMARKDALSVENPQTAMQGISDNIIDELSQVQDRMASIGADYGLKDKTFKEVVTSIIGDEKEASNLLKQAQRARAAADAATGRQESRVARAATKAASLSDTAKGLLDDATQIRKVMETIATQPKAQQDASFAGLIDLLTKIDQRGMDAAQESLQKRIAKAAADPENEALLKSIDNARSALDRKAAAVDATRHMDLTPEYLRQRLMQSGQYKAVANGMSHGKAIEVADSVSKLWADPMVGDSLARAFRVYSKSNIVPEEFSTFAKSLEVLWKQSATIGRGPAFVSRNISGGLWNMFVGGGKSQDLLLAKEYVGAYRSAMQSAMKEAETKGIPEEQVGKFLDSFLEKHLSPVDIYGQNAWEVHKRMEESGVMGSITQLVVEDDAIAKSAIGKSGARMDLSGNLNIDELGNAQRAYYKAANAVANNPYYAVVGNAQETAERFLRSAQYFAGLRQSGVTDTGHKLAELLTKATQFDYADMSPFEQRVLKHVFPFFTWSKNNIPLQVRNLMHAPGKVGNLLRANYYAGQVLGAQDEFGALSDANRPDWLKSAEAWTSIGHFGTQGPIMVGIGAPVADLNRFVNLQNINSVQDIPGAALGLLGGASEESIAQMNPLLKFGVEKVSNKNIYTGTDYGDVTASPLVRALTPGGRFDPETGKQLSSGFWQQQLMNFVPTLGWAQRVLPYGPLDSKNYKGRMGTSVTSNVLGLSGLPIAPLATASESSVTGVIAQNTKAQSAANKSAAAEAGLDWGEMSRAANGRSWSQIADMVERGWFEAPYVKNNGGPTQEQIKKALEIAARMRQLDQAS